MRNIKNTPAVTSVEEWTNEDTGVGALMAKGSHLEKGNWALFVNAAIIKINIPSKLSHNKNFHPPIITLI